MPVLTSLSLDTCTGVGMLIMGLAGKAVGTVVRTPEGTKIRRSVKFCPRFEALSLWGCEDVKIDDLRALVIARSRHTDEEVDRDPSSMIPKVSDAGNKIEKSQETTTGRAIKPLRKSRLQHQAGATPGSDLDRSATTTPSPSVNILSAMIANGEASQPATIGFIRIEDCPLITHREASTLKNLGVVDVVCGSELGE